MRLCAYVVKHLLDTTRACLRKKNYIQLVLKDRPTLHQRKQQMERFIILCPHVILLLICARKTPSVGERNEFYVQKLNRDPLITLVLISFPHSSRLEIYEQSCAVDSVTKKCAGKTSSCRVALLGIMGTPLRTLCACHGSDLQQLYECLGWQRLLWLNPCVGKFSLLPRKAPITSNSSH